MFGTEPPQVERVPLGGRLLAALAGQQPTGQYVVTQPRRRWWWRIVRGLLKLFLVLGFVAPLRPLLNGRLRRNTYPLYLGLLLWCVVAVMHYVPRGWVTVAVLGACLLPHTWQACALPAWKFTRRRNIAPVAVRRWYAFAYVGCYGWSVLAAVEGAGPPRAGYLALIVGACWVALLWRNRTRPTADKGLTDVEARWYGIKGGETSIQDTRLVDVEHLEDPRRVRFEVDLTGCHSLLPSDIAGLKPHIAKAFGVTQTQVMAGYRPDQQETLAHVEIVFDNPTAKPVFYDESWMPTMAEVAKGIVPFHLYPNGERGYLRMFYPGREPGVPGAGCIMDLFTGDIGSGKSGGMATALTQYTMSGLAWPMAACPQGGASYPQWAGANGQAAWKAGCRQDEHGEYRPIWDQLCFLNEVMEDRTERLGRFRWVDAWGEEQVGLANWDYDIIKANAHLNGTTAWPMIVAALDEMWKLMLLPEYAALIKAILKLGRKAGIKLMGATQYPGLDEFNNDAGMRQPIVSGNVLAYRNSESSTGTMVLDAGMPAPSAIPQQTPAGEDTKGTLIAQAQGPNSSRTNYSRSVYPKREMHYARMAAERIHPLEPEALAILRKYVPEGQNWAPGSKTSSQLAAEAAALAADQEATGTAPAAPAAQPAVGRVTVTNLDKVLVYLATRADVDHTATTGTIAGALGVETARVSEACNRALRQSDPRISKRDGAWTLGDGHPARQRELVGV